MFDIEVSTFRKYPSNSLVQYLQNKTNEDTINANDNVNPSSGSNYIPTSPKDPHTNV